MGAGFGELGVFHEISRQTFRRYFRLLQYYGARRQGSNECIVDERIMGASEDESCALNTFDPGK